MTTSTVNCLIDAFATALNGLGCRVAMPEVERLAIAVHRAMDHPRRAYHCSRHVLEVARVGTPLGVLAAMFHDVVYVQLDGGFPLGLEPVLSPYIQRSNNCFKLHLPADAPQPVRLCAEIFGYVDGQLLQPLGGLNEFASAIVACDKLLPYLSLAKLAAVVACIEATIPFRGVNEAGLTMPQALLTRLRAVNSQHSLGFDEVLLEDIVREAVSIANQDVNGFSEEDPGVFLSNTWLLMEESNAALASGGVYTISDYRSALLRMATFLSQLKAEHIFHTFDGVPSEAVFKRETEAAKRNVSFSYRYLAAKLTAVAIIEAIALQTGEDCPVSMLLGHIRRTPENPHRIEDFLPMVEANPDVDPCMLEILDEGRRQRSANDLTKSPLTAYVYRHLGEQALMTLFGLAKQMFAGELPPYDFLQCVPEALRESILNGCAQISLSRRDAITCLSFKLPQDQ